MGYAPTKLLEVNVAIGNAESRCLEQVWGKYLGGFQRMRQILVQRLLAYKDGGVGPIVAVEINTGERLGGAGRGMGICIGNPSPRGISLMMLSTSS